MSIIGSNILAGAAGSGVSAYEIEQSLRFDGSAYLNRTPGSAGNRRTFTFSAWVKRANLGATCFLMTQGPNPGSWDAIRFDSNDRLAVRINNDTNVVDTARLFRDPSAWYHIVIAIDTTQATAANRVKIYINNQQDSINNTGYPSQNQDLSFNNNIAARIGVPTWSTSENLRSYLAEVNFIDGSALAPTDFGEFDDNGVWRPIRYAGSYTGNSFYLKFASGDGTDSSGLSNTWTANNFTTSGTGTDVMSDTPTTNYPTWNALERGDDPATSMGVDLSEGNLVAAMNRDVGDAPWVANFTVPSSGKWYWEVEQLTAGSPNPFITTGIIAYPWTWNSSDHVRYDSRGRIGKDWNGVTYQSVTAWGAGFGNASDVCGVAVDADNNTVQFYLNGTSKGTTESYSGNTYTYVPHCTTAANTAQNVRYNFGQRAFAYTPPTGFKALNTSNLPAPDIADGSDYFDTVLWTGNQTARTISMNSTFTPDFIWIKNRTSGYNHSLQDIVRGYGPSTKLNSNTTTQENAANTEPQAGYVDSVAAGSFDIDASATATWYHNNLNSNAYVGWCWDAGGSGSSNTDGSITSTVSANPTAGFSIVTYTGTGVNSTVGHGLGVQPSFYVVKPRSYANNWPCWHKDLTSDGYYIHLNYSLKQDLATAVWNGTGPSSTVFNIGTNTNVNQLDATFVAYVFAEVEGYSKISSWAGNGSTDGPFVHCGFRPAFLLLKNYRGGSETDWIIQDSTRSTYNVVDDIFRANTSQAEASGNSNYYVDFLSNGFKIRTSSAAWNESGSDYLFLAFAENPFGGSGVSPATAR